MASKDEHSSVEKWTWSVMSTILFVLISMPAMYKLVQMILPFISIAENGCPTYLGLFLHSIVYLLLHRTMIALNVSLKN